MTTAETIALIMLIGIIVIVVVLLFVELIQIDPSGLVP